MRPEHNSSIWQHNILSKTHRPWTSSPLRAEEDHSTSHPLSDSLSAGGLCTAPVEVFPLQQQKIGCDRFGSFYLNDNLHYSIEEKSNMSLSDMYLLDVVAAQALPLPSRLSLHLANAFVNVEGSQLLI